MKVLYLDLGMGAAGDMLTAALYELLDDNGRNEFIKRINSIGIPGVEVVAQRSDKCGICGTHMKVVFDGHEIDETGHDHNHHHEHDHENEHQHHHGHGMKEIETVIDGLDVSSAVKNDIRAVYTLIAEAESKVHGKSVTDIHFHEVGTMDALADISSVCMLMEMLAVDRVIASPVCTGYGSVKCAHGILNVPAPATADILTGIPMYAGDVEGELCTPTGAALVKHFTDEYSNMPVITSQHIGYGMGHKDFVRANCLRAIIGTDDADENVTQLSCNIDDMTGEALGFAMERLLSEGALEVFTTDIGMKKSRPGIMLSVFVKNADTDRFVELIFKYTSTIGIRKNEYKRYVLRRFVKTVGTSLGDVNIKTSEGYDIVRTKIEYEDLSRIAASNDMSIDEVKDKILREINEK